MRGEVTCSGAAKAATGTGSAAWAQMQASPNAAATTAMLHCFMRFPKPAPPAGRPSIRSAAVRWRGGAPPMAVGGAVDRPSIFPDAFRSEEHTSEIHSLMRHSYADFCLDNKKKSC